MLKEGAASSQVATVIGGSRSIPKVKAKQILSTADSGNNKTLKTTNPGQNKPKRGKTAATRKAAKPKPVAHTVASRQMS